MNDQRCENCLFWNPTGRFDNSEGECRINPPVATKDPADPWDGRWPVTLKTDWCGCHVEKTPLTGRAQKPQEEFDEPRPRVISSLLREGESMADDQASPQSRKCESCEFWSITNSATAEMAAEGICTYNAPQIMPEVAKSLGVRADTAFWPVSFSFDSCRHWEQQDQSWIPKVVERLRGNRESQNHARQP